MRLEAVFYSKDELAIQMDFTGRYPFPDNETSELFALACFTLRQLSNLGEHIASQALAAVLVTRTCIEKASQRQRLFRESDLSGKSMRHCVCFSENSCGPNSACNYNH